MSEDRLPIIAINNTGSNIFIADLGLDLLSDSTTTLSIIFPRYRIVESDDLNAKIQSGDIIINDGSKNLNISEAIDHITFQTEYEDRSTLGPGYHIGSEPPEEPEIVDGWFNTDDKILYVYDRNRSKWLSIDRANLVFQKTSDVNNEYLNVGQLSGSDIGYLMPRNGTIVSISGKSSSGLDSKGFQIRNDTTSLLNFQYSNDQTIDTTANIDFDIESLLQCFVNNDITVPSDWYDGDWLYRKKITVNSNQVAVNIIFDNVSSSSGGSGSSLSFSHTISGNTNRMLIVCAGDEDSGTPTVTGITYNGISMTQVAQISTDDGTQNRLAMFYLPEANLPSAGTYTVTITYSATTSNRSGGAMSFYNVKQQAPKNTQTAANQGQSSISVNVTTDVDNSWVVDTAVHGDTGDFTQGSNQIERFDISAPSSRLQGSTKSVSSAGSTTMSQTIPNSRRLAQIATVLEPVGDLNNFPVLVSFTNSDLSKAKSDGSDFVFTDSTNSLLSFEIERFVKSTGELVAWVKLPTVSSGDDVDFYLYYGNSDSTSQQNVTDVWSEDFKNVYHMSQDPSGGSGSILDSLNEYNGTPNNMGSENLVSGKIGQAIDFNGTNEDISLSTDYDAPQIATISMWINRDRIDTLERPLGGDGNWEWRIAATTGIPTSDFYRGSGVSGVTALTSTTNWYYIVFTYNNTTDLNQIFVNGILDNSNTLAEESIGTVNLRIGSRSGTGYFDGIIDEVRISTVERSSAWVQTEFNNQNDPSSFLTLGSEEGQNTLPTNQPIITVEIAWRP